jgi:flagellar L-ring protein FlgH
MLHYKKIKNTSLRAKRSNPVLIYLRYYIQIFFTRLLRLLTQTRNGDYKIISLLTILCLSACSQLENIGKEPEISPSLHSQHSIAQPNLVNYNPAPKLPQISSNQVNNAPPHAQSSLWQSGPSSLFGDRRAKQVGDILTVDIVIDDKAEFNNKTERKRTSNNNSSISAGFGVDTAIEKILPSPLSIKPGLESVGDANTVGDGKINRREKINLKIAAIVTNILPNGNMVIQGSQEVRVNYELRDLQVTGLIRPEDISRRNTISYEKIAEARISYGGRGQVSGLQQPRYGDQFFDVVSPF